LNAATQTALRSRLTGDAAVAALVGARVYHLRAPETATLPYVVFFASSDLTETEDPHRRENQIVTVKALAAGDTQAEQIDAAVDAALDNRPLTVSGYVNIWLRRTGGIPALDEDLGGGQFVYQRGSTYRLRLARA